MNPAQACRVATYTYITYMLLMTVGMSLTSLVYHDVYPSLTMVKVLIPFEIAMTLLCAIVVVRFYQAKVIFGPIHSRALGWMSPLYLTLIVAWGMLVWTISSQSIENGQWYGFLLTGLVTLFVGISEELMFRGIILQSLLKTQTTQRAVLISALTFSSLHAINIIAHHSWVLLLGQLATTFIFGLFAASVTLRLNNLLPMIIFHWLWDFLSLTHLSLPVHAPVWIAGTIGVELVLGIILWNGLKNHQPAKE